MNSGTRCLSLLTLLLLAPASFGQSEVAPVGFYTDRASYGPGDQVKLYANWETGGEVLRVRYRLHRVARQGSAKRWQTDVLNPVTVTYPGATFAGQALPYGAFVEFPGVSLDRLQGFNLRGWIRPTLTGESSPIPGRLYDSAIVGHLWHDGTSLRGTGIGIDAEGRLFASLETELEAKRIRLTGVVIPTQRWSRVRLDYDGSTLTLELADLDQTYRTSTAMSGLVEVAKGTPFRIGARGEAPGDQTGCFSGRLDDFRLVSTPAPPQPLDPAAGSIRPDFELDFEDVYGAMVRDRSAQHHHGRIVGHGTPGVSGRNGSQGLRLNYDQVHDAGFRDPVELGAVFDLAQANLTSGLYVVEAVHADATGAFVGYSELPPVACVSSCPPIQEERWQCFVVRAPLASANPIAVVVPVFTWMAYNDWPGFAYSFDVPMGLTVRTATNGRPGNNAAYSRMGDGVSANHYLGWRRPGRMGRPFPGSPLPQSGEYFNVHAATAVKFFEWLDELYPGGYDVFTDQDLDADTQGWVTGAGSPYDVVMTMGHHEYWSEAMLVNLNRFLERGGTAINLAGNLFAYRSEYQGGTLEVKAWPVRLKGAQLQGKRDAQSLMEPGRWTGFWRLLKQLDPLQSPEADDLALGTIADLVSPCTTQPACFSKFAPGNCATHWIWQGNPPSTAFGASAGLDGAGIVGHEADSFVASMVMPALLPGTTVERLAQGALGSSGFQYINYPMDSNPGAAAFSVMGIDSLFLMSRDASFMNDFQRAYPATTPSRDIANITYYCHRGGGHVLSVPTTAAAWALALPVPGDSVLKDMVEHALGVFLSGSTPACVCSTLAREGR